MQFLQGPAGFDELHRQVVEQFRVSRRIAAEAEIARRADDAEPEMMHPHAIDDHARGERVGGIDDGLRQFEPPAAVVEDLVVCRRPDNSRTAAARARPGYSDSRGRKTCPGAGEGTSSTAIARGAAPS